MVSDIEDIIIHPTNIIKNIINIKQDIINIETLFLSQNIDKQDTNIKVSQDINRNSTIVKDI